MAEQRRGHRRQDARMHVARTGPEEQSRRRIQLTGDIHVSILNGDRPRDMLRIAGRG